MPADEYEPLRACLRAKRAWEKAGPKFRLEPQLSLFDERRYGILEAALGRRADRRRRYRPR